MTAANVAAHGGRQPVRMRIRRAAYGAIRAYQKVFGRKAIGDSIHVVGDRDGVEARLNWYLPDLAVPLTGLGDHAGLARAEADHGLDPDLTHAHPAATSGPPTDRAHLLLTGSFLSSVGTVLRKPGHSTVISPSLYGSADTLGYLRLRHTFADRTVRRDDETWPTGARIPESTPWAVVVATGPSVDGFDFDRIAGADVRVTCNSAVRNQDLLERFRPNVLCFGDPVFHFGPSRYARAFRDDVERALDLLPDLVLSVPEHFRSLLVEHVPACRGRTIGLTLGQCPPAAPPARQGAIVRRTGNVLTQQMLPMALQRQPQRLSLVGCDGRQKSERYFWRHGKAVQYSDELMASVFDCHPSFFRDVSYADYYARHCTEVAQWVSLAESHGADVDTLTPSFIPVLAERLRTP